MRPAVVVFSAQDYWYHNRAHSDVQLARALSADSRVLLVNSLGLRMPTAATTTQPLRRVVRKLHSMARTLRRPEPAHRELFVLTPISVPLFGHPIARRINARFVAIQVRVVLGLLGRRKPPDVLITLPTAWDVVAALKVASVITNRSDKYSELPEANQQLIAEMEREMLAASDAAVYVSHRLLDEERDLVKQDRAIYLGHGVDFDHFDAGTREPVPADIATIAHPRVGFFGGIDDYVVDLSLIAELAKRDPDLQIVLIGAATCPMDDLTSLPNIHWLGMREYEQIPAYGAAFDVAIMPWLDNEWIEHCNPIKVKEYLALGLPVVTTPYPEANSLADVIAIADGVDDFVARVQQASRGEGVADVATRRERVRNDSWTGRAAVLRQLQDEIR